MTEENLTPLDDFLAELGYEEVDGEWVAIDVNEDSDGEELDCL